MKLILGLGNPGAEYSQTRHNAGIDLVDAMCNKQWAVNSNGYGWRRKKNIMVAEFPELVLIKTADLFMNESGNIIREIRNSKFKIQDLSNLYLAHDDLDIKLGEYKVQFGVGPKVHNGVESVERALGTREFLRIRIGIDNRKEENRMSGENYVLQRFSDEEKVILDRVLERIVNEVYKTNT